MDAVARPLSLLLSYSRTLVHTHTHTRSRALSPSFSLTHTATCISLPPSLTRQFLATAVWIKPRGVDSRGTICPQHSLPALPRAFHGLSLAACSGTLMVYG